MSLLLLFTGARRRRWFPAPGEAKSKKSKVDTKEQILIEDNETLELITVILESGIL